MTRETRGDLLYDAYGNLDTLFFGDTMTVRFCIVTVALGALLAKGENGR
jgi:hypothetical protein